MATGDARCQEEAKMSYFTCSIKRRWIGNNANVGGAQHVTKTHKKNDTLRSGQTCLDDEGLIYIFLNDTAYEFIVLVLHSGDAEKMGDTTFSCYLQQVLQLKSVFFLFFCNLWLLRTD